MGGWWWCKPILVLSFGFGQAEQLCLICLFSDSQVASCHFGWTVLLFSFLLNFQFGLGLLFGQLNVIPKPLFPAFIAELTIKSVSKFVALSMLICWCSIPFWAKFSRIFFESAFWIIFSNFKAISLSQETFVGFSIGNWSHLDYVWAYWLSV